jgi:hypothetical protein
MKKKPIAFGRLGLEIFSIVFAVLLALMLDSWQERLKVEKKVDRALRDIVLELKAFQGLEGSLEYNKRQLEILDSLIFRHEQGDSVVFYPGIARPEIRSLTWQTSRETGITADFERSIFLDITELYVEFERLEKILDYSYEFMLKSDPNMSPYTRAIHKQRQLRGVIFRSEELLRKTTSFFEKYKDARFTQVAD